MLDFSTFEIRVVDVGAGSGSSATNDLKTYGGEESFIASLGQIKPFEAISFASDVYLSKLHGAIAISWKEPRSLTV